MMIANKIMSHEWLFYLSFWSFYDLTHPLNIYFSLSLFYPNL